MAKKKKQKLKSESKNDVWIESEEEIENWKKI